MTASLMASVTGHAGLLRAHNWGEPERAPLLRGKQCGGPCTKNRNEKGDCNTLL